MWHSERGFSFIDLLTFIVIAGLVAVIAIPAYVRHKSLRFLARPATAVAASQLASLQAPSPARGGGASGLFVAPPRVSRKSRDAAQRPGSLRRSATRPHDKPVSSRLAPAPAR